MAYCAILIIFKAVSESYLLNVEPDSCIGMNFALSTKLHMYKMVIVNCIP